MHEVCVFVCVWSLGLGLAGGRPAVRSALTTAQPAPTPRSPRVPPPRPTTLRVHARSPQDAPCCPDLLSSVRHVKPTVLIGLSDESPPPFAFTREAS